MNPEILVKAGLLDQGELDQVRKEESATPRETLAEKLIRLGYCTEEEIAEALAMYHGVEYVDLRRQLIPPAALAALPVSLAVQKKVIPLAVDQRELVVAVTDPTDVATLDLLAFASGKHVRLCTASAGAIRQAISKAYGVAGERESFTQSQGAPHTVEILERELLTGRDLQRLQSKTDKTEIVRLVDGIIYKSIMKRASDIHIEPQDGSVAVRNRVDGVLQDLLVLPGSIHPVVASRLKIMAGMNIADRRVPQDGRIKVRVAGQVIDLRVSTLPTQYGEKVVIRVLSAENTRLAVGDLGFVPEHLTVLHQLIRQPQGMLIVSGPTGAGKTTTLYSLLADISNGKTNIVTLEDPIEYVLPGANQVQINEKAGLTFAKCLRSILRQDPNIIFVGEIRDAETAEIAMRAALTGHFVFTTVHSASVFSTITRLVDLGVDATLISSSVTAVIGQRLLRRICERCREEVKPEIRERREIEGLLGEEANFLFYRGRGCPECGDTGYRGRIATYELLRFDSSIRHLIHQGAASEGNLLTCARQAAMRTMLEDAVSKVRQGITTIDEVQRVLCVRPGTDRPRTPCPSCGQPSADEWKSCPFCGERLAANHPAAKANRQVLEGPDSKREPRHSDAHYHRVPEGSSDHRILLVDDEVEMLHDLVRLLLRRGYSVQLARDGGEALRLVAQDRPDLVIADVLMPGMNGIELIAKLRGNPVTKSIPIIVLSKRAEIEDRLRAFEAGTDDYVGKPFSAEEVLFRARSILGRVRNQE